MATSGWIGLIHYTYIHTYIHTKRCDQNIQSTDTALRRPDNNGKYNMTLRTRR